MTCATIGTKFLVDQVPDICMEIHLTWIITQKLFKELEKMQTLNEHNWNPKQMMSTLFGESISRMTIANYFCTNKQKQIKCDKSKF